MKTRQANGYALVYDPANPNAYKSKNWAGWVYLHVKVASEKLGRRIEKGENVHHKDGNKKNNDPENIEVLSNIDHGRFHATQGGKSPRDTTIPCEVCGLYLGIGQKRFCSIECLRREQNSKKPTKDDLIGDLSTMKIAAMARKYRVSFNAVKKWLKSHGIPHKFAERKVVRTDPAPRIIHGSLAGYKKGCRCDECRLWRRDYERRYRSRLRAIAQR